MFIDIGTCNVIYKYHDINNFYIRGEPRFFREDAPAAGVQKVYWLAFYEKYMNFGHFGYKNNFADFYVEISY